MANTGQWKPPGEEEEEEEELDETVRSLLGTLTSRADLMML